MPCQDPWDKHQLSNRYKSQDAKYCTIAYARTGDVALVKTSAKRRDAIAEMEIAFPRKGEAAFGGRAR